MKTKKILTALIAVSMLISLSACTKNSTDDTTAETEATEKAYETTETFVLTEGGWETIDESEGTQGTDTLVTYEEEETEYIIETVDINDLEEETFEKNGPLLAFHYDVDFNKVLKTDLGTFFIPNGGMKENEIIIKLDDTEFKLEGDMDSVGSVSNAYLIQKDGNVYLYAESSMMDDYTSINVYKVADGSISHVGTMSGVHFSYFERMEDLNSFVIAQSNSNGGVLFPQAYFEVGTDGMPSMKGDVWEFADFSSVITFNEDKIGYIVKDGKATSETFTVEKATAVVPYESDLKTYIDFKAGETIVRIDCVDAVSRAQEEKGEYYNFINDVLPELGGYPDW
ncbi:MAG: hypothetical protein J6U54_04690 [Clostridiales bacterium]|nr:hypothetical protein [Clostridiales bacterium]